MEMEIHFGDLNIDLYPKLSMRFWIPIPGENGKYLPLNSLWLNSMSFSRFGLLFLNIFSLAKGVAFDLSGWVIILLFVSSNSFDNSLSKNWLDISLNSIWFSWIDMDWNPSLSLKFKCENRPLTQSSLMMMILLQKDEIIGSFLEFFIILKFLRFFKYDLKLQIIALLKCN